MSKTLFALLLFFALNVGRDIPLLCSYIACLIIFLFLFYLAPKGLSFVYALSLALLLAIQYFNLPGKYLDVLSIDPDLNARLIDSLLIGMSACSVMLMFFNLERIALSLIRRCGDKYLFNIIVIFCSLSVFITVAIVSAELLIPAVKNTIKIYIWSIRDKRFGFI